MRLLALAFLLGSITGAFALGLSDTNSGVYLGVESSKGRALGNISADTNLTVEPFRFDAPLVWRTFCNTGAVQLNYPTLPYLAKIEMVGPDGKSVAKTSLGRSVGAKFDEVKRFEDAFHGWTVGSVEADSPYDSRDVGFSGPRLPAPGDMFEMEKPGSYKLELQMQMFRVIKGTNQWTRQLIRFSPIHIRIEKPAGSNSSPKREGSALCWPFLSLLPRFSVPRNAQFPTGVVCSRLHPARNNGLLSVGRFLLWCPDFSLADATIHHDCHKRLHGTGAATGFPAADDLFVGV